MNYKLAFIVASAVFTAAAPVFSVEIRPLRVSGSASTRVGSQRIPSITTTGVSLGTTSTGALTETSTGLEKVTINAGSQKIEVYAGVTTTEVTLFEPTSSKWINSTSTEEGDENPLICSATSPTQNPNTAGTLGDSPSRGTGRATPTGGAFDPNPLANATYSAGTMFARDPYGSSGSDAAGATPGTPLQLVPYPGRDIFGNLPVTTPPTTFPTCGG